VTELAFLSPDLVRPQVTLASPLARALSETGPVRDVSRLGKLELRGDLAAVARTPGEELIPIAPGRALLVTEGSPAAARTRLRATGLRVYDLSAGLAALEVDGAELMRRLTDLDLEALPAAGAVARGVAALVQRRGGETFRIFVQQELGHYVAQVALDAAEGLRR
jgi:sarcosine oxidase gamma subunit